MYKRQNIGKASYTEWQEWIESVNDDLPEPENMADAWNNLPELSPPLIDGVLRQGHKMLLAGPSKAGKSYALIELSCAIAEGRRWLSWVCARGKVLYAVSYTHLFVLLDKLEQMDIDTLRSFGMWLEQEGLQAIATRVSTGSECSIIIEDGYIAGETAAEPVKPDAPNWKAGEF